MGNVILVEALEEEQLQEVEALYLTSFPDCERKPFSLIVEKSKKEAVDIWRMEENGSFCGLIITMKNENLVLIDYFAISLDKRGMGYGRKGLELIRKQYEGDKVFLEIESTLEEADNREERLARKAFYLKNGLREMGIETLVFETIFELLTFGEDISFEEYLSVYIHSYGEGLKDKVFLRS